MSIVEINNIEIPELAPFATLTEHQLRQCNNASGLIIVESPKVIRTALSRGLKPVALLCERKHIDGDAAFIIEEYPQLPVYTGPRELLKQLTGYTLTRGVLCAMERPAPTSSDEILANGERICVIHDICDTTNIGAIFRSAAGLGIDGILLSPQACDPFNRRSIRVSMGAVFQIPWCFEEDVMGKAVSHNYHTIAMALRKESVFLQDFEVADKGKYAIIFGSEGYGLPENLLDKVTTVVKIPMHNQVDSLNVAAAAAITMWHFARK